MLNHCSSTFCLPCFSKSFYNFISNFKGLDHFILNICLLQFCVMILGFLLFNNLPFIIQKHAFLEKLHGLYKSIFLRNREKRYVLSLFTASPCRGRGALSKHCHDRMLSPEFLSLISYLFSTHKTVRVIPTLGVGLHALSPAG